MEQPIKVLLVDDKEDYCKSLSGVARLKNIQIVYSLDWETGFEILKNDANIEFVILDGKGKVEADQAIEHERFALKAMKDIDAYGSEINRDIPYCLNTGYIDSFGTFQGNVEIFEKSDDQRDKMFEYIKDRVSNSELYSLKNKYPNPIMLCTDAYIGAKHFDRIIGFIKDIENSEKIKVPQDMLNPMRKILEAIFDKLYDLGLIPDAIQNGQGAINGASIFLAGNNKQYLYKQALISPVVAESIRHLISLTQDASHNEGNKLGADTYLSNRANSFLYQSLCYSLLEVLDYLKPFIDANSDKVENQSKWQLIEVSNIGSELWIKGKISRIAENGYGTFQPNEGSFTLSILPNKMDEYSLTEDQNIEVTTEPSRCGTKTYIKDIKILE